MPPKALSHRECLTVERVFTMPWKNTKLAKERQVRDKAIVYCLMYIGLSLSETESLILENVEIARTAEDSKIYIHKGKGAKRRVADMPPKARVALAEWLEMREQLDIEHNYLFVQTNKNHETLGKRAIQRIVEETGYRAKLELSPQILRHTAIRFWREETSDIVTAMQIGHSFETMKRYPLLDN